MELAESCDTFITLQWCLKGATVKVVVLSPCFVLSEWNIKVLVGLSYMAKTHTLFWA